MAPARIGYVGVGLMGLPMVKRLVARGHDVVAYDIVDKQVQLATAAGARAASTASQAVREAEFVLLNLPTTDAVEQAVFGPDGVASAIEPRNSSSISRPTRSRGAGDSPRDCASKPVAAGSTRRSPAARPPRARAR